MEVLHGIERSSPVTGVDLNSPRFRSLTLEEQECREDDADPILREVLGPQRFAQHMLNTYGDVWLHYVLSQNRRNSAVTSN